MPPCEALIEESGFDIRRIAAAIRKSEVQGEAEGWKHIPAALKVLPGSAFRRTRFARHEVAKAANVPGFVSTMSAQRFERPWLVG